MRRRTLVRRIGAATVGAGVASGTASASSIAAYGITRELDVSDVSGAVPVTKLLTDEEIARLPDHVTERRLIVDSATNSVTAQDCCTFCADTEDEVCDCFCCETVLC